MQQVCSMDNNYSIRMDGILFKGTTLCELTVPFQKLSRYQYPQEEKQCLLPPA